MHPLMILGFALLGAVALSQISHFTAPPVVSTTAAVPAQGHKAATPNHDPHHARLAQPPAASAAAAATPNHDPRHARPVPSFALDPVTLAAGPEPVPPSTATFAAVPEPKPTLAPAGKPKPAPTFVQAEALLYAKGSARLRAAPSTKADVLARLAVNSPLQAVARSSDGAWWRVALGGGRLGYVHEAAVSKDRVEAQPQTAAPTSVAAATQPAPTREDQGLLGYVDETMDWLADKASRGTAPKPVRPER
ncbi:hypothetical protein DLREEDagr8_16480 [Dongia sp. agr-C8]